MKTAHTEITFLLFVFDSLRTIDIKKILLILILIRNQCSTRKTGTARGVSDILVGYSRRFCFLVYHHLHPYPHEKKKETSFMYLYNSATHKKLNS